MAKHASILWTRLRRVLAAAPGRFPGGSAWIEPMSLLAVERERLAAQQRSQQETSPPAAGDGPLFLGATRCRPLVRIRTGSRVP